METASGCVEVADGTCKVPLRKVDWTYHRRHLWTETGERLPSHPRPPYYHDSLFTVEEDWHDQSDRPSLVEDVELNASLTGVSGTEDTVKRYETAVGIAYELEPSLAVFYPTHRPLFAGEISEEETVHAHTQWAGLVDELLGGIFDPCDFTVTLDPDYGTNFMAMDTASGSGKRLFAFAMSLHATDYAAADTSFDSDTDPVPTTPDADKKSYAEVLFVERSRGGITEGPVFSPAPSKALNAAALSFVPAYNLEGHSPPSPSSDYPYVSPTYEFHFPSLNKHTTHRDESRSVPPPLQRDEHGFYTEVSPPTATRSSTPRRQSGRMISGFLDESPSPARSRSSSKTRELVDRLRSSAPSRRQRKNKGEVSSLRHSMESTRYGDKPAAAENDADDADGWITSIEGMQKDVGTAGQEDWVQGLFQCRSPSQSQTKRKGKHERSTSTSTVYTTSTPTSASSHPSTLPSPAASISSIVRGPPKAPVFQPPFPPLRPFLPFPPPYASYPGLMPPGMVPPQAMMQLPPSWHMSMPPAVFPAAMYAHRA